MKELLTLNKYIFKYKWRMLMGVVFIVLSNLFNLYPAQMFRTAMDMVVESIKSYKLLEGSKLQDSMYENIIEKIVLFSAVILILALAKGLFTFFMRYTIIMVSRFIEYDLKNDIFKHYQELDISFYKSNNTGDIMNRIGDDVSKVRMYLGPSIMYIINLIVLFILVITTMVNINPMLSLYILLPLPIMSITIYFVSKMINEKSTDVQEQLSKIFNLSQETFSGIRVIKAYNKTNDTLNQFDGVSKDYQQKALSLIKTESLFHPVILFLPVLSTLITVYVGGIEVTKGNITYGNIAEFVIYINLLTWPVASLGWVTSLMQRATASMVRINEFLQTEPKIKNQTETPIDVEGKIEFKNVSFTYPENEIEAIKNLSFTIEKGKTLAIVGKTGSGKSSIVSLLNRLYDVNSGEILIDNQNIQNINLFQFRAQMGCVPQEVFLFSETIAENIAFGKLDEKPSRNEIEQAAKNANVHSNIVDFEKGYDTLVGERGVTLSGGQKQRISIARAIIKEPKILVFDDCLSAVDTETEEIILKNLKGIMKDRTTVIVSHRISSIKHADHILYLENGTIKEEGSHDALLALKGDYFELNNKQIVNSGK